MTDRRIMLAQLEKAVAKTASELLKTDADNIEFDVELSVFGFDSESAIRFTDQLNEMYELDLEATVFFEYPTLGKFCEYLVKEYHHRFENILQSLESEAQKRNVSSGNRRIEAPNSGSSQHENTHKKEASFLDNEKNPEERIAIVGVSGCFPQAENIGEFWENLKLGIDCITEVPSSRWDWHSIFGDPVSEENKSNVKWGGFISGVDEFDPLFFNISPHEARLMDPQQRLLMTHIWKCIEDAGYAPSSLSGSNTAILIGTADTGYASLVDHANLPIEGYSTTGVVNSVGPNRMSYFLDFHGPSQPIETACSSSLVAIHRGVELLRKGEIKTAIVGGVNTLLSPEMHISFTKAGMLSVDGRCKTFSKEANGYVRGEGVGILMLKPLKQAELDKDNIYGLILASEENHGGKANSLTAPNPLAQAELLKSAYRQAKIDPRTVTYIETHGTGTELGDPIETKGISLAFKSLYSDQSEHNPTYEDTKNHTGLGSVKTNIGHLELSAGVAGVIKVLLQMKHKMLVKSLHSKELNPLIKLEESPFYVVQEAKPWNALTGRDGKPLSRRAGISSFGFGGVNAHLVVEEYIGAEDVIPDLKGPVVILLSARSEIQLIQQAGNLLKYLETENPSDSQLISIAYTLQIGRESMTERLATTVISVQSLIAKLGSLLQETPNFDQWSKGTAKKSRDVLQVFGTDRELDSVVVSWVKKRKYENLVNLWVNGLEFDWLRLYEEGIPKKANLPSYPFARERYWIESSLSSKHSKNENSVKYLHPLVHENTSNFRFQRYASKFSGEEIVFQCSSDSVERNMAQAAYLEMVKAAISAANEGHQEDIGLHFSNVIWGYPIGGNDSLEQVHIALAPSRKDQISCQIYSASVDSEEEYSVHFQSDVQLLEVSPSAKLNMQDFMESGSVTNNGAGKRENLIDLDLPILESSILENYFLHPFLLDCLIKAVGSIGSISSIDERNARHFAVESINSLYLRSRCINPLLAWVREVKQEDPSGSKVVLDVDFCDEKGNVSAKLVGLTLGYLSDSNLEESENTECETSTVLVKPVWLEDQSVCSASNTKFGAHNVVLFDSKLLVKELQGENPSWNIRDISLRQNDLAKKFQIISLHVFELIQSIARQELHDEVLIQIAIHPQQEKQCYSALSALLKTALQEYPKLIGQVIVLDADVSASDLGDRLRECSQLPNLQQIRYSNGKRFSGSFQKLSHSRSDTELPWKAGGLYLITGGNGALGYIFAKEIAEKAECVTLVLTGRSELDEESSTKLEKLTKAGAKTIYKKVDVSNISSVEFLVNEIENELGKINGIVHCAGICRDRYLFNKTSEEFMEVLKPKVEGTSNLDIVTRNIDLDFFVLFSSLASVLGNPGQIDYATGNAFMDAFAVRRNELVQTKQRKGRTLSINWPFWRDGGMEMSEQVQKEIFDSHGLVAIDVASGIESFYRCLLSEVSQAVVMNGNTSQITRVLLHHEEKRKQETKSSREQIPIDSVNTEILRETTRNNIELLFSEITEISVENIDMTEPLSSYGINSLMITRLNQRLGDIFGELSRTLFFEYQTLEELANYLFSEHPESCSYWAGFGKAKNGPKGREFTSQKPKRGYPRLEFSASRIDRAYSSAAEVNGVRQQEPIAIIGLVGRYPDAKNIREYWQNLSSCKNSIVEIPEERWSVDSFYLEDKQEAIAQGKSYSKWGGFIDDFSMFDALFFGISPKEALGMDPQERIFLQACWELIEDAGYTKESIASKHDKNVGVFAGVCRTAVSTYGVAKWQRENSMHAPTSFSSIANRVSYILDLQGPCMPIDTMCSSSLTAIHEACEHIRRDECEMAIAGGVNLYLDATTHIGFSSLEMLSQNQSCRSFDKKGDGTVLGEGVGVVLLKKLSDAIADRDQIHGVIRATNVNHSGRSNGYRTPNPASQSALIRGALDKAGINARQVSYVEAQGIGIDLGDTVEIEGLNRAFQVDTQENGFCALGSVKSNIGHLEAAAGIAGVTKVLLQMKNNSLVPSPHAGDLNPVIDLNKTPFVMVKEFQEWRRPSIDGVTFPRLAGVSSFGAGGSNAHLLIEEYNPEYCAQTISTSDDNIPAIVVLSAKDGVRLKRYAQNILQFIQQERVDLASLAYTLQVGREAMEARLAIVANSISDLQKKMSQFVDGDSAVENLFQGKSSDEILSIFGADEDLNITISAWIEKKAYKKLAKAWVQGMGINWEAMHDGERKFSRISLPTYPFATESYWRNNADDRSVSDVQSSETGMTPTTSDNSNSVIEPIAPSDIEAFLISLLSDSLGIEPKSIPIDQELQDFGVDSYLSTRLLRSVENKFKIEIPRRQFVENRTIASISRLISSSTAKLISKNIVAKVERKGDSPSIDYGSGSSNSLEDDSGKIEILNRYRNGDISFEQVSKELGLPIKN